MREERQAEREDEMKDAEGETNKKRHRKGRKQCEGLKR